MKLTKEEALLILDDDHEKYKLIEDTMEGNGRCGIYHTIVVQELESNNFYISSYSVGATENQDEGPWEHEDTVDFYEAEAYETTVTEYRKLK